MRPLSNPPHMPASRSRGFTLVELIITLSVLGILLTIGVPMLRPVVRSTGLRSTANRLVTALNYTRSEAVTRGRTVAICASANPMAVNPTCVAAGNDVNWATGWLVFVPAQDGTVAEVLRVNGPFAGDMTLTGNAASVAFSNMGVALQGNAPFAPLPGDRVYLVRSQGLRGWDIRVVPGGRINNQREVL